MTASADQEYLSDQEIKRQMMKLSPGTLQMANVRALLRKNTLAGFVVWDASPPPNVTYPQHVISFITTLYTGLSFCGTDTCYEWCVLGQVALVYMRAMAQYEAYLTPTPSHDLVYVGNYQTISLYTVWSKAQDAGLLDWFVRYDFVVGTEHNICAGKIENTYMNRRSIAGP